MIFSLWTLNFEELCYWNYGIYFKSCCKARYIFFIHKIKEWTFIWDWDTEILNRKKNANFELFLETYDPNIWIYNEADHLSQTIKKTEKFHFNVKNFKNYAILKERFKKQLS